jgi:hypothetical protein
MKLTNNMGLNPLIVKALSHDEYDYNPDIISATQIMSPPLMYALKKLYPDKLERDVSENCASVFGSAVHALIETVDLGIECIKEERLTARVQLPNGHVYEISGKFDLLIKLPDNKWKLVDTKTTSVWTRIYNSHEEDYIHQLSIYRYINYFNGREVIEDADIWFWFTDWSRKAANDDPSYPQLRTEMKPIKLMSIEDTEHYIIDQLMEKERAVDLVSNEREDEVIETDKELWRKPDVYAVMQEGKKYAVKLFETEDAAKFYIQEQNLNKAYIDLRKGKVMRCEYCDAWKICNRYKQFKEQGLV